MIEGNISVKAVLQARKRDVTIVYVDEKKKDKDTNYILRLAKEQNVPIKLLPREEIDALALGKTHGGLLAEANNRPYEKIEDYLIKETPFFALVEGVEDPFNLGYIMRTLYSAGCDGLFLPKRDWSKVEDIILKSSAGAFEWLPIFTSDYLVKDIETLKAQGIYVYAAMRKEAKEYDEVDYQKGILIMIGGEMRGLSSQVLACADQNIYIPYANDFHNALNAAAATAIFAFEVKRQRKGK